MLGQTLLLGLATYIGHASGLSSASVAAPHVRSRDETSITGLVNQQNTSSALFAPFTNGQTFGSYLSSLPVETNSEETEESPNLRRRLRKRTTDNTLVISNSVVSLSWNDAHGDNWALNISDCFIRDSQAGIHFFTDGSVRAATFGEISDDLDTLTQGVGTIQASANLLNHTKANWENLNTTVYGDLSDTICAPNHQYTGNSTSGYSLASGDSASYDYDAGKQELRRLLQNDDITFAGMVEDGAKALLVGTVAAAVAIAANWAVNLPASNNFTAGAIIAPGTNGLAFSTVIAVYYYLAARRRIFKPGSFMLNVAAAAERSVGTAIRQAGLDPMPYEGQQSSVGGNDRRRQITQVGPSQSLQGQSPPGQGGPLCFMASDVEQAMVNLRNGYPSGVSIDWQGGPAFLPYNQVAQGLAGSTCS